jgi:selT/selW/selH-like putative selenoprotein
VRARLEQQGIGPVTIAPGSSGQFDVTIDGRIVFSRRATGRFPSDAEVDSWAQQHPGHRA